ncbi:MAG: 3-dehydroquinate synthase [Bryobacterales bacterium]|jgi:3-dehydroquinate synthase|nr:3-dehydroquinate synthase [Bryobacterales bacterium]
MPQFEVSTPQRTYAAVVERGAVNRLPDFLPAKHGKLFVVTTQDVWELHAERIRKALDGTSFDVLFFTGGEQNKRMAHVEQLAEEMAEKGADRSSVIIAFGGGIVTDLAGFLAAIFMRGIPVIQIATTLLAQVDAAVGGKTGSNLVAGKNLVGVFHQPLAVLIDPAVLTTLPEREYRAGLYEIIKTGIIASEPLFRVLADQRDAVLAQHHHAVDHIIAESVRIKAEVVSSDERESGRRKILNFGHTFGHSLEAETHYKGFLHGEAVSWGMRAATHLAHDLGLLPDSDAESILFVLDRYGPIPSTRNICGNALQSRLVKDKKTIQSKVHFVLPTRIGDVIVKSDVPPEAALKAIRKALADTQEVTQ